MSVGGIAQLGERLHGMQEVSGSIPLTSTSYNEASIFSMSFVCHAFLVFSENDIKCTTVSLGPHRLEA